MQIERSTDCGNSPKNRLAEDAAIALICGEDLNAHFAGSCRLEAVGADPPEDGERLRQAAFGSADIRGIAIKSVATHGRAGAIEGEVMLGNGATRAFCLVIRFASAKADRIAEARLYAP